MLAGIKQHVLRTANRLLRGTRRALTDRLRPTNAFGGVAADFFRSRHQLLAENALLRQQLIVVRRRVKRPKLRPMDRLAMLLAAARTPTWPNATLIIKPETILRWHREGFRLFWRMKSRSDRQSARIDAETVTLIQRMARDNRLWGAERIRGELIKLGIRVSKRTIQKYRTSVARPDPSGQSWETFIRNHADDIWACDFLQTYDRWFRPIFAFFIINVGTREIVSLGATRNPDATWTARQIRNVTAFGADPRFVIRDRDAKFGAEFDRAAVGAGIRVIKTAVRTPNMNAHCERFLRSARTECLDHFLIADERHLDRVLREYAAYFNAARPHQGLDQHLPGVRESRSVNSLGAISAEPVLNGLHHDYQRAA